MLLRVSVSPDLRSRSPGAPPSADRPLLSVLLRVSVSPDLRSLSPGDPRGASERQRAAGREQPLLVLTADARSAQQLQADLQLLAPADLPVILIPDWETLPYDHFPPHPEIIAERIGHSDTVHGFILDGFPRTVAQAEALDELLDARDLGLDAIIEITVDEAELIERIAGRAKETGGTRGDDKSTATRLEVYRKQTAPVAEHYRQKGVLVTVDGMGSVDDVARLIDEQLEALVEA